MTRSLALAVLLAATAASAQDVGQTVRGEITASFLRDTPRRLAVRLEDGTEVEATLAPRTRVTFQPGVWRFDSRPDVADLQRGMRVEFRWSPRQVDRVRVVAVPPEARPGGGLDAPYEPSWSGAKPMPAYEAGRELHARVIAVQVVGGTLTVSVDGREQVFLAAPSDLRGLTNGDRVVLVTGENGRLVSVRPDRPSPP